MKRVIFLILTGLLCLTSCEYDDAAIWDSLRETQDRVAKLEKLCEQLNTNINGLQTIVQALQENDYVTSITPIRQSGAEIGYALNFSKSGDVTIYHGKDGQTPKVGVKAFSDGLLYWTLEDEWLLDGSGKKIRAEAVAPQLKIEDGWWYVSTDKGKEWTKLDKATGEDGDAFFQNVVLTESEVEFVLSDGQRFTLPRSPKLSIRFDQEVDAIEILAGETVTLNYTLEHADENTVISVSSDGYYRVRLQKTDLSSGKLVVESPEECVEGYVNVYVSDGKGFSFLKVIRFVPTAFEVSLKGITFKMIKVVGGTFMMGGTPEQGDDVWPWEKPVHQVTLSDYWIGETEVTQELWEALMGSNPSKYAGMPKNPVDNVSWLDVVNDFLPKINALTGKTFSLPTEAQWEFAARGGNKSQGYKYSGGNDLDAVGWYDENTDKAGTQPVAQKIPNELGIYDMAGNVMEWCNDWLGDYTEEHLIDPVGPATGNRRIIRGGFHLSDSVFCRVSHRSNFGQEGKTGDIGFRLVCQ